MEKVNKFKSKCNRVATWVIQIGEVFGYKIDARSLLAAGLNRVPYLCPPILLTQ